MDVDPLARVTPICTRAHVTPFAQAFKTRLPGSHECWTTTNAGRDIRQPLVAKESKPLYISEFGPIAVLPVLYKVRRLLDVSEFRFASRRHYQAHEVVLIIRPLIENANE